MMENDYNFSRTQEIPIPEVQKLILPLDGELRYSLSFDRLGVG
jgi:hypothetical protein